MEEDIQTLEDVINVIENLINKYKELEKERDDIYADYQDLGKEKLKLEEKYKELKCKMGTISEICVDESKCHITSKEAVEEIRKNIFWEA